MNALGDAKIREHLEYENRHLHERITELEHENAELRQKVSDVEWDHGFRPDSKGDPEKWWERLRKKAQQECDDG